MKTSTKLALALTTAALLSAPQTTPAFATADGPDYYRVINVNGDSTLNLRARPGTYSRVINKIPFNARHLGNAVQSDGRWTRISYGGQTGWVHNEFLAEDYKGQTTIYKVVGINSWDRLNIRKKPKISARIISDIPGTADYVEDCGTCKGLWCPVRYNKVDGWVHKKHLAVVGYPRNNQYSGNRYNRNDNYDQAQNNRQDFQNRYGNEYMGLRRHRKLNWFERWQNRRANRRAMRNGYWLNRGSRY